MRLLLLTHVLIAVSVSIGPTAGAAEQPVRSSDVQRAIGQFHEFYLGSAESPGTREPKEPLPGPDAGRRFAESLQDDGAWPDIDYASSARSGWEPLRHWTRTHAMVVTAVRRGAASAERTALLAAAHRAFGYWIAHDFQSANWWYNEIGIPKAIGAVALLLGEELAPSEYDYVTSLSLARYPIRLTGQNKVWLAANALMRGLLMADEGLVREATTAIWSEARVTVAEGVQPDFSFHQHGPQQQFGNYGMSFALELARWALILRDTPWQLADEKLIVFRRYLLDGQNWVSWRGAMDISACGRQLMPGSPRIKTTTIGRIMRQAAEFDRAHAMEYAAFLTRNQPGAANELVGNRYFWRSDYLVHRQPDFMATLKLSSNRVIGAEVVIGENLSGYYTADGALYVYRDSGEYEDIFPVWDWRKVPGVTCAQTELPAFKTAAVPRDFVGGVSDGAGACAALDYARDGVHAKKAWFFTGDTVVCLGADIGGPGTAPVVTTLNQSLLRGPVRVTTAGTSRTLETGSHTLPGASTVEHDGWRYTLLEGGELRLDAGAVTGNWRKVFDSPETPVDDVTKDVFTLWLDHGVGPQSAGYGYVIQPAAAAAGLAAERLIENSPTKQALLMSGGKVAIVFWAPGELRLPDGRQITVSAPCLVLAGPTTLRVVDPTQKLLTIRVTVDGTARDVALPTGGEAGTASVVEL